MASFSNDYTTIHDCETIGSMQYGGATYNLKVGSDKYVEGSASIELRSNVGDALMFLDCADKNVNILEQDLIIWFHYVKGKSKQYLTNNADSIKITLTYSDDTYADWYFGGHDDQITGWKALKASGATANAVSIEPFDYNRIVSRITLTFNMASANGATADQPFYLDYWHSGTTIICENSAGDWSTSNPENLSELETYDTNNGLGVVTVDDILFNLNCGLDIRGHFYFEDKVIVNEQLSTDVEHPWHIRDNASLRLGNNDSGYPIDGCNIECIYNMKTSLIIEEHAYLFLYRSKLQNWSFIQLGNDQAIVATENIIMIKTQFVNCDIIELRKENSNLDEVRFISSIATALKIYSNSTLNNLEIILNNNGIECNNDNVKIKNSVITNNTINLILNNNIDLVNCDFNF